MTTCDLNQKEVHIPAAQEQHWLDWSGQHTACAGTPWLAQTVPWTLLAPTEACSTHTHSWLLPSCRLVELGLPAVPADFPLPAALHLSLVAAPQMQGSPQCCLLSLIHI